MKIGATPSIPARRTDRAAHRHIPNPLSQGVTPPSRRRRSRFLGLAGAAALLSSIASPALAERPGRPALVTLLHAFAERRDEKAVQTIPSIEWNGVSYPNDSEKDNSSVYVLQGRLRLNGFGTVDVPVGVGANQTTRKANEGETSFEVRFSSASNPAIRGPLQITMIKLYPSSDQRRTRRVSATRYQQPSRGWSRRVPSVGREGVVDPAVEITGRPQALRAVVGRAVDHACPVHGDVVGLADVQLHHHVLVAPS